MVLLRILLVFIFCYVAAGLQHWDVQWTVHSEFYGPIVKGTKWCGPGNISSHENDFGSEIEADKCCQTHDNCPDVIEAYQTKHDLTNTLGFSRVLCKCDTEFHSCLKKANTKVSNQVGNMYFNFISTQCFTKHGNLYKWEDKPGY